MIMDTRPIGVFDSGLGGLTVVKQLKALLPSEQIVYFGDTARVPYGTRSRSTLMTYAGQDSGFLLRQGVKLIVAACGTISSTVDDSFIRALPVPYCGVIEHTAAAAAAATRVGKVGIIGTTATVNSGSFARAIHRCDPKVTAVARACPLFVPLVENGYIRPNDPVTTLVAQDYLSFIREKGVDTLILGCTHFPILAPVISRVLGDGVTLIDPGVYTARQVAQILNEQHLAAPYRGDSQPVDAYYITDQSDFQSVASIFMGDAFCGQVQTVDVNDL